MNYSLANKRVLLGISAGIAAYKTPDLVRRLQGLGAEVKVVLSRNAEQFVTPLSLQAVSGESVHHYAMTAESESGMGHIDLARWADIVLIAPATANMIARLTQGMADELLTTICVATSSPIVLAPAMNQQMWLNEATQANIAILQQRGFHLLGPDSGEQACGEVGPGRMLQPEDLAQQLAGLFQTEQLAGKNVMITAGPTWEAIDPVRVITNHSSGKMGYALAQAAADAGAKVTLISGPTNLATPDKVTRINIKSAQEMYDQVMHSVNEQDIFIGVAAVADYRPISVADNKIKKKDDTLTIEMVKNPDILASVSALKKRPFCVGFAAETNDVIAHASDKLKRKKLDLIAANQVGNSDTGFGTDDNVITLISKETTIELPRANKSALARSMITEIAKQLDA